MAAWRSHPLSLCGQALAPSRRCTLLCKNAPCNASGGQNLLLITIWTMWVKRLVGAQEPVSRRIGLGVRALAGCRVTAARVSRGKRRRRRVARRTRAISTQKTPVLISLRVCHKRTLCPCREYILWSDPQACLACVHAESTQISIAFGDRHGTYILAL